MESGWGPWSLPDTRWSMEPARRAWDHRTSDDDVHASMRPRVALGLGFPAVVAPRPSRSRSGAVRSRYGGAVMEMAAPAPPPESTPGESDNAVPLGVHARARPTQRAVERAGGRCRARCFTSTSASTAKARAAAEGAGKRRSIRIWLSHCRTIALSARTREGGRKRRKLEGSLKEGGGKGGGGIDAPPPPPHAMGDSILEGRSTSAVMRPALRARWTLGVGGRGTRGLADCQSSPRRPTYAFIHASCVTIRSLGRREKRSCRRGSWAGGLPDADSSCGYDRGFSRSEESRTSDSEGGDRSGDTDTDADSHSG